MELRYFRTLLWTFLCRESCFKLTLNQLTLQSTILTCMLWMLLWEVCLPRMRALSMAPVMKQLASSRVPLLEGEKMTEEELPDCSEQLNRKTWHSPPATVTERRSRIKTNYNLRLQKSQLLQNSYKNSCNIFY